MNITDTELAMLEAVTTDDEWNQACDAIKRARGGAYPPDWWAKVKLSGLMDRVMARFGETSDLRVVPMKVVDGRLVDAD